MKQAATDLLNRRDLRQKIRRELLFGLFPKTLNGKDCNFCILLLFVLVGVEQQHFVHNAFNILVNEGFLRDQQGVQTLEVVRKFYEIINEKPRKATMVKKCMYELCKKQTLKHHAVIILLYDDSKSNVETVHAVRVSKTYFSDF